MNNEAKKSGGAFATFARRHWLTAALIVEFAVVVVVNAWVCDDAYISFRTVDNFVHGRGLRWNIDERVQTYTHPLWMLLVSVFYFFTREPYFTSLALSFVFSVGTVALVAFAIAETPLSTIPILLILTVSKAFVDYSTSGLENALTHFLLALFFFGLLRFRPRIKTLFLLSIIASLAGTNRMDALLIFLPPVIYSFARIRSFKAFGIMTSGFVPFVAWEIFSLIYYGFPFPNTAYAKLGAGIPALELANRGLYYLLNSIRLDPITLLAIVGGMIAAGLSGDGPARSLTLGIILHLLYVVRIGGDFMSGRFLAAPLLCSVILLSRRELSARTCVVAATAVAILGLLNPLSPIRSGPNYPPSRDRLIEARGVSDERGYYYPMTGLLRLGPEFEMPKLVRAAALHQSRREPRKVAVESAIGFAGYNDGPWVHLIDPWAIADPLMARLPAVAGEVWRPAHFRREIPTGYLETLESGENRIQVANLALYYDKLRLVTQGSLWNRERWITIAKLNFGAFDRFLTE